MSKSSKRVIAALLLTCACSLNAQIVINEFMADNETTIQDEDQDYSDWIEIKNTSAGTIDLTGWYLTDDATDLTKWQFPATTIQGNGFLIVFASEKTNAIPGGDLHAGFKLSKAGEYLALVRADGSTVEHEYVPAFPPQVGDVSYGIPATATEITLVADQAACSARVPTDASEGTNWLAVSGFDDAAWNHGTTGVGYEGNSGYETLIHLDLESDMYNEQSTAYIRIPFNVASVSNLVGLTLRMKYDDGFIAYLNGVEVASANPPPNSPLWDSPAGGEHDDAAAVVFEDFDILAFSDALVTGQNMLGIHALNRNTTSSDLLILPELECTLAGGPETNSVVGYLAAPTPGVENTGETDSGSETVVFSIPGAVHPGPISVELFATNSAQTIYFTLDGSEPGAASIEYTGAISINSTTILRARSFEPGLAMGPINSETYLFLNNNVKSFSSDLPIVVVDNLGEGTTIPTDPPQSAFVGIFEPGTEGRTFLTNSFTIGSRAGIRRRGQTSLRATDRKPNLAVETWGDGANLDANIKPFGMPAESDWILWAPYNFDQTGLRNAFIYELSNQTGNYAVRTRFVEVFLNVSGDDVSMADYAGLYFFMEKIKRDNDRVDVEAMTPLDNADPNVTGGYILAIDKGGETGLSGMNQDWMWCNYPQAIDLTTQQKTYIQNFIGEMETQLGNPDPTTGYPSYIDVEKFIDHNLLNVLAKNVDALRWSTHMSKPRGGKLAMGPIWDFDRSMESSDGRDDLPNTWNGTGDSTLFFNDADIWGDRALWWRDLFKNADFSQLFVDRWQALRPTVLSDSNVVAIMDGMASEIAETRQRDIAKWPVINPRTGGNGLDGTQQGEVNHMKWWLTTRMAWIDDQFIHAPVLSTNSGPIAGDIQLIITGTSGHPIYYTEDGSDPRLPGGTLSSSAIEYTGAITVSPDTIVQARAWDGTAWGGGSAPYDAQWSGLAQGVFYRADQKLLLTEVHYNPESAGTNSVYGKDDFEFVELQNIGTQTLNLRGYELDGGIRFLFSGSAVEWLPAGEFVLVVRNLAAFASRYNTNGVHIAGEYAGKLANGGDNVRLEFYRHKLFDILYNDARGWPSAADGGGHSLIPLNASVEEQGFDILDYGGNWRASTYVGGSPGEADPVPAAGMVINEVIAHTDTGMAPPYDSNDKIELYNPTSEPITLDGFWFLSDNTTNPEKYTIPSGLMIPSGGWVVFDEDDFHSDRTNGFGLDKAGEQVVFSHRPGSGLNRVVDCIDFKGQANGASWGRYPDGNVFFQNLDPTAGAANQLSASGILIGELMYNPLTVTGINADEVLEYILLTNVSASTISFDGGPGLSNTWRLNGGVGYDFDPGTFMTAGEHLWVVPFDPVAEPGSRALFCSTYGLNAGTARLLGPYSGDLSDIGERFTLERPQASDDPLTPGDISWIIVDEVTWMDEAPWPEEADGTGRPLVRVGLSGNDSASWSTSYDSDNDGLPDLWEQAYRIALTDLGAGDFDLDGFLDVSEYVAGSNPDDPGSLLKFMRMEIEGTEMVLSWQAVAGKTYAVWIKTNLSDSVWSLHEAGIPGVEPTSSTTVQTDNTTGFIRIEVEQ